LPEEDSLSEEASLSQLVQSDRWSDVLLRIRNKESIDSEGLQALYFEALFRLKLYDDLCTDLGQRLSVNSTAINKITVDTIESLDQTVSLRLLLAEAKLLSGRGSEAMDLFRSLQQWLETVTLSPTLTSRKLFWHWQVRGALCNALIRQRSWKPALRLLRTLSMEAKNGEGEREVLAACEVLLLSRLGRLLLQVGAVQAANAHMESLSNILANFPSLGSQPHLQTQSLLLQGLLQFAEDKVLDNCTFVFKQFH
jgi:hypothetical protein